MKVAKALPLGTNATVPVRLLFAITLDLFLPLCRTCNTDAPLVTKQMD